MSGFPSCWGAIRSILSISLAILLSQIPVTSAIAGIIISVWVSETPFVHNSIIDPHLLSLPWDSITLLLIPDQDIQEESNGTITIPLGRILSNSNSLNGSARIWRDSQEISQQLSANNDQLVTLSTGQIFNFEQTNLVLAEHPLCGQFILQTSIDSLSIEQQIPLTLSDLIQPVTASDIPTITVSTEQSLVKVDQGKQGITHMAFQQWDDPKKVRLTRKQTYSNEDQEESSGYLSDPQCLRSDSYRDPPVESHDDQPETSPASYQQESENTPTVLFVFPSPAEWVSLLKEGAVPTDENLNAVNAFIKGRDYSRWIHKQSLGGGNFATVDAYHAPDDPRAIVAFKQPIHKPERTKKPDPKDLLKREALLLLNLRHPHIIGGRGCLNKQGEFTFIMEYASGVELFELIKNKRTLNNPRLCTYIIRQVFDALDYLHERRIAHKDLKPENIMINPENPECSLKVIDFNLAASQTKDGRQRNNCGSPIYAAPELFIARYNKGGFDGLKADIWCAGSILFTMYIAATPYTPPKNPSVAASIRICQFRLRPANELYNRTEEMSDPLIKQLVTMATKKASVERSSAREMIRSIDGGMSALIERTKDLKM